MSKIEVALTLMHVILAITLLNCKSTQNDMNGITCTTLLITFIFKNTLTLNLPSIAQSFYTIPHIPL